MILFEFSEALHMSRVDIVRKVSLEGEASSERRVYRVTVSLPLLHKEPGHYVLYFCAAFFYPKTANYRKKRLIKKGVTNIMGFKSDIEIAQETTMAPITAGIDRKYLEQYGNYKAKIDYNLLRETEGEDGKLILVTAINPTPAGEGKTTTSVGLADGMSKLGKKVMVALREPSLGPVFHAIGAANNLLAAMIDNHIFQGNALNIDPRKITWKRCVDMNDRQLRNVVDGLGGKTNGMPREDGYDITVASEIMAVLCLARDITDLKERLSKIIVGYTYGKIAEQKPVTAGDLNAQGAMAALLKDALKPNLVQTLEHTPAIVHGGPFANIAHGCNSVTATKMCLKLADYTITEAGFGADLGAEKFLDIKCRMAGLKPNAVVIVATVRALKYNGGVAKADLNNENLEALEKGMPNLLKHVSNITNVYKLPCVVAINAFPTDTEAELKLVEEKCKAKRLYLCIRTGRFNRRQTECDRSEDLRWQQSCPDSKRKETGKTARRYGIWQLPDLYGKNTVQLNG